MLTFVDVSEKSDDGIKKSLEQIYKTFGVPVGYTVEQLTELVKNSSITQINESLLNLLVAMNKLQKDETQKSNLNIAIEQLQSGNIDESLFKGLNSILLSSIPNTKIQSGSDFDLNVFSDILKKSGIAPNVIEMVNDKISTMVAPATVPTSPVAPVAPVATSTPTATTSNLPSYMRSTASSSSRTQKGGEFVLMTVISVGLLILVIVGNKEVILSTVSDILGCFSSKTTSGGKKSKRMQNKSKRHRKSRRNRKSKRRQ